MTVHHIGVPQRRAAAGRLRRRATGAWFAVVLLLVVLGAAIVVHSPWMSVREIEIVGANQIDVAARLEAADIGEGAILMWLDTNAVEEAIVGHPWAADVSADRIFPDRLVVEVREHQAVAWIEGERSWMLVAEDGSVLESTAVPAAGALWASLPFEDVAVGLASRDAVWHEVVELGLALDPEFAAGSRLVWDGGEVWMEVPGHRARFGHPIDLAEKGLVLQALLAGDLPPGAVIDVVAPRRPAVVPQVPVIGAQDDVEAGEVPQAAPPVEGEGSTP